MQRLILLLAAVATLSACGQSATTPHSEASPAAASRTVTGPAKQVWEEGKHYDLISTSAPHSAASGRVEVMEFFWYGCPHCYTFESFLVLWNRKQKPAYVDFVRVPVMWKDVNQAHARLYYTLQALHREDLHHEVFDEIHRLGNSLFSKDAAETQRLQLKFARDHGITADAFLAAYNSEEVQGQLKKAEALQNQYLGDHGIPAIVVDRKYYTDSQHVDNNQLKVVQVLRAIVTAQHEQTAGTTSASNTTP